MRATVRTTHLATCVALAGLLSGCARYPAPAAPGTVEAGWVQEGEASWYGPGFHGKQTASGEVFDMEAMTAAHRELPFGSRVRVINLDNGEEIRVRINDRGPFARGRVLDLSRAAARELGMLGSGTARVRIEVVESVAAAAPSGAGRTVVPGGCTVIQVGAYSDRQNASEMARRLEARGEPVRQVLGDDGITRVLVGPYETEAETRLMLERFDGLPRPCDP